MSDSHLTELLCALGPEWSEISTVDRLDESTWLVALDDETQFAIEVSETARLMLTCPLGRPHVDRRFVVFEAFLVFNSLWQDHPGCTMALGGPEGDLLAIQEVDASHITASDLQTALAAFAEHSRGWRDYVVAEPQPLSLPSSPPMLHLYG